MTIFGDGEGPIATARVLCPDCERYCVEHPWEYACVALAGVAAEQHHSRVDAAKLVFGGGKIDMSLTEHALRRCAQDRGASRETLVARIAECTITLVRQEWARIEAVAEALDRTGELDFDAQALYRSRIARPMPRPAWRSPRWTVPGAGAELTTA